MGNDLDAELAEMKTRVAKAEDIVNENSYHVLLKLWGKLVAGTLLVAVLFVVVAMVIFSRYPQAIPSGLFLATKIENVVSIVLAPSVTTIGLVLGFTPVMGFFFVNSLKDDRREFKEMEKRFLKKLYANKQ